MRRSRWAVMGRVLFLMTAALAIAQDNFGEEMNLGIQAYKAARFDEAITHFRNAVSIRPQHENAHLYLATAYAQQYIPGVESVENLEFGNVAIAEYQKVLEINPKSYNSLKGSAFLYLQMKKFADAKAFLSQGHRCGSGRSRDLLHDWSHRLDPDVRTAGGAA